MTISSLKYPNLTIDWNSFHQFIRKQQLAKSIFMTIKKCSCVFLSHVLVQKTKFWHSIPLLQKPFYWSLFIPLIVPNKNRFSSVCSLPRSSALLPSYMQAGIHGSYTAPAYASLRQASAQTDCIQLAWVHWQLLASMAHKDCMLSTTNKRWRSTNFYVQKHLCFYINISTALA